MFMKKAPEPGEPVHPMMEGLQQLKFDPLDNSPEELAEKYKEDGNYWLKLKKFRIAIFNYTEGLLQKPDNEELMANLYNNRSASHFFLKNFRSSFEDAKRALKYKNDYPKVKLRLLKCLIEIRRYEEACKVVQEYLSEDPTNIQLIEFQKLAITKKTEKLRDERKVQMQEKKKRQEFQALVHALLQRRVKFAGVKDLSSDLTEENIKPVVAPLECHPVSIDKNGTVHWPVMFCYPEYSVSDFQQCLNEMETLDECLENMFTADDEQAHNYQSSSQVAVYFENRSKGEIHPVDMKMAVKDVVSNKDFFIYDGYLLFYVLPKNSKAENEFINQKRK